MKLEWENSYAERYNAHTPFGSYHVEHRDGSGWQWGYCFDEYYDEDQFGCPSLEEGKKRAEADWQERIEPIIAPYLNEENDWGNK